MKQKVLALLAMFFAFATNVYAEGIVLINSALKETEVRSANGTVEKKLVPAGKVVPGDRVIYTMKFTNQTKKPAENFVITNPVPTEVAYLGAANSAEPQVSVDGGRSFALLSTLKVKNADGSMRAARTSDVTHVRWQIVQPVKPGETGSVSYRGQLK